MEAEGPSLQSEGQEPRSALGCGSRAGAERRAPDETAAGVGRALGPGVDCVAYEEGSGQQEAVSRGEGGRRTQAVPELEARDADVRAVGRSAVGRVKEAGADRLLEPGVPGAAGMRESQSSAALQMRGHDRQHAHAGRERKLVVRKDLDDRVVDDDRQVERCGRSAHLGPELELSDLSLVADCEREGAESASAGRRARQSE